MVYGSTKTIGGRRKRPRWTAPEGAGRQGIGRQGSGERLPPPRTSRQRRRSAPLPPPDRTERPGANSGGKHSPPPRRSLGGRRPPGRRWASDKRPRHTACSPAGQKSSCAAAPFHFPSSARLPGRSAWLSPARPGRGKVTGGEAGARPRAPLRPWRRDPPQLKPQILSPSSGAAAAAAGSDSYRRRERAGPGAATHSDTHPRPAAGRSIGSPVTLLLHPGINKVFKMAGSRTARRKREGGGQSAPRARPERGGAGEHPPLPSGSSGARPAPSLSAAALRKGNMNLPFVRGAASAACSSPPGHAAGSGRGTPAPGSAWGPGYLQLPPPAAAGRVCRGHWPQRPARRQPPPPKADA
ncbi:nascent polypeptide-associated complex subunit alpha, muscle-specific form-like [Lathamus discolor]|uniref:nascent polypeptide-associated complex subunit alpha, muscle-specific form-like n=1 Tax=Lathamus discolor TaxID=678569 RepID=UPI0032B80CF7